MKFRNTNNALTLLAILFVVVFLVRCKKTSNGPKYVITYTGSLITHSTIIFSCNVPVGTRILWDFDDASTYPSYNDSAWAYSHGGTYIVKATVDGDTANIATKTITINYSQPAPLVTPPQGTIRGKLYYQLNGAYPYPIIYLSDTTGYLNNIDPYTISFDNQILYFSSESDSVVTYSKALLWESYYNLTFNKYTNFVQYSDYIHISAAGSKIDSFSSY